MSSPPASPLDSRGAGDRAGTPARAAVLLVMAAAVLATVLGSCASRDETTPPPTGMPTGADFAPVKPAVPVAGPTITGNLKTSDGRTRTFHLYVPSTVTPGKSGTPVPLLVALHGAIGWGLQFESNSGFSQLAQANNFIVVYPDGVGAADSDALRTWNGGNCCGPAVKAKVDDVGFINSLIESIESRYPIDRTRVFAAGHSNGGIMSYRLACELSDTIVAVGSQAGPLGIENCRPSKPVSLIHLHGTEDENVPIDGGMGNGIANVEFVPAMVGAQIIARADGCAATPSTGLVPGNPDVSETNWQGCQAGSAVTLLRVEGASHAWMGHPAQAPILTGAEFPKLDASTTIWSFLAAHPRR